MRPSAANFLLVDVAANIVEPAERERRRDTFWQALLDQGVMTRRLSGPRLAGMIRITVGTNGQNLKLRSALIARDRRSGPMSDTDTAIAPRVAERRRVTRETDVTVRVHLDPSAADEPGAISTSAPFLSTTCSVGWRGTGGWG